MLIPTRSDPLGRPSRAGAGSGRAAHQGGGGSAHLLGADRVACWALAEELWKALKSQSILPGQRPGGSPRPRSRAGAHGLGGGGAGCPPGSGSLGAAGVWSAHRGRQGWLGCWGGEWVPSGVGSPMRGSPGRLRATPWAGRVLGGFPWQGSLSGSSAACGHPEHAFLRHPQTFCCVLFPQPSREVLCQGAEGAGSPPVRGSLSWLRPWGAGFLGCRGFSMGF